jgi:hypothetical protein
MRISRKGCMRWRPVILLLGVCAVLVSSRVKTVSGARGCCYGDLWLSWSSDYREAYVHGFRKGLDEGAWQVCKSLFSGTNVPAGEDAAACIHRASQFSHIDSKFYSDKITEFYQKYPKDRWLFASEVLLDMADSPGLTIDQIHEQSKKRHHP